jgi:hypothetical protein
MIQIFVKTLNNRTIVLDIEPYFSVELLKDKIEDKEGIPSNKQRLVMGGKTLINGKKLYDYNIQNNNTIHVMISLLGGKRASKKGSRDDLNKYPVVSNEYLNSIMYPATPPVLPLVSKFSYSLPQINKEFTFNDIPIFVNDSHLKIIKEEQRNKEINEIQQQILQLQTRLNSLK